MNSCVVYKNLYSNVKTSETENYIELLTHKTWNHIMYNQTMLNPKLKIIMNTHMKKLDNMLNVLAVTVSKKK